MASQQHTNAVLTSIEPAILVYSRAAVVLQGEGITSVRRQQPAHSQLKTRPG